MRIVTSHNRSCCYQNILYIFTWSVLFGQWLLCFSSAFQIRACEQHKCTPYCVCDLRDTLDCAKIYGNYGWNAPANTDEYILLHMHQPKPIEYYQIKPAGMQESSSQGDKEVAGEGVGFGKILSIHNESLVGQVYFEVHPDQLQGAGKISVELYGNVGFGLSDCAEHGTLLSRVVVGMEESESFAVAKEFNSTRWGIVEPKATSASWFSSSSFAFPEYNTVYRDSQVECHPRSTGAVMAGVEYTIAKPFQRKSSIWFPDSEESTEGRFDYCIRVKINPQAKESNITVAEEGRAPAEAEPSLPYQTYLDTKIRIEGDQSQTDFQSSSKGKESDVASTHSSQAIEATDDTAEDSVHIKVVAVPCSDGGRGKYNDHGTILSSSSSKATNAQKNYYAVGQVFRVCVSPSASFVEDYSIAAFESVVCENFGEGRRIVQNFAYADTSMEPEEPPYVAGSTSASMEARNYFDLDTGTVLLGRNTLSFRTRVTPGFRSLNETSLVCSGIVRLRRRPFSRDSMNGKTEYANLTDSEFELLEWTEEQKTVRSDFSASIDLLVFGQESMPGEKNKRSKTLVTFVVLLFLLLWFVGLVLLCRFYHRHFLAAFPQFEEPLRRLSDRVWECEKKCKEWLHVNLHLHLHLDCHNNGDGLEDSELQSNHRGRHDRRRDGSRYHNDSKRRRRLDRHHRRQYHHYHRDHYHDANNSKYRPSKHNHKRSGRKRETQRTYIDFSGSLSDSSNSASSESSITDVSANGYIPAVSILALQEA